MPEYYFKHYIRIASNGDVMHGFSSAFEQPESGNICINDKAGRQFMLLGQYNPSLHDMRGLYLYRYVNGEVVAKTPEEIEAEIPAPAPLTPEQQRERAYETLPIVPWPDADTLITVDEANRQCTAYRCEGAPKAGIVAELEALIHTAKEQIRTMYPDAGPEPNPPPEPAEDAE